jgi:uncharacterized membrane protein
MSDRALWRTMVVLGVIGLGIATFLTILHYTRTVIPCVATGNPCETVQTSVYASVFGIPVATLGLAGYVAILASLLVPASELSRVATLGVTLFGFVFSAYLTYREVFTLHAICEWCVSSACLMTLLFICAAARYLRGGAPFVGEPSVEAGGGS